MDLNIKYIGEYENLAFYAIDEYPQLIGIWPFTSGILKPFLSRLQLKYAIVLNTCTKDVYKLKQKNLFSKFFCIATLAMFSDPVSAPFHFYINGQRCGKFKTPFVITDDKEHEFEYKNDKFIFSFHKPNVVAVMLNDKQVMKFEIKNVKKGGNYLVKYDPSLVNDTMLIFTLVVCIDNIIYPIDWMTSRLFGPYNRDKYPERAKWLPGDDPGNGNTEGNSLYC